MKKKQLQRELAALLERSPSTTFFLEAVSGAIEELYADDEDDGCAEGFKALDTAAQEFEAYDAAGDEDDEDDEDDEA